MSNTVKTTTAPASEQEPTIRNATVEFHGRRIEVKPPTPEQMAAITSYIHDTEALDPESVEKLASGDAAEIVDALGEALDIATCLCVDAADRRWVRRGCLHGKIQLADTTSLIVAAFRQLAAANPHLKLSLDAGDEAPAALVTD